MSLAVTRGPGLLSGPPEPGAQDGPGLGAEFTLRVRLCGGHALWALKAKTSGETNFRQDQRVLYATHHRVSERDTCRDHPGRL